MSKRRKFPIAPRGFAKQFVKDAIEYKGNDCLMYPYGDPEARPRININGKPIIMARAILEGAVGPAPEGKPNALHDPVNCSHDGCCSPAHLRWGSQAENGYDRYAAGTAVYEPTPEVVAKIRDMYRRHFTYQSIADAVGWSVQGLSKVTSAFKYSSHRDITYLASRDPVIRQRVDEWADIETIDTLLMEIRAERRSLMNMIDAKPWVRDRKILVMRRLNFTLQKIGNKYGITRERVRQIEERGAAKIICIDCRVDLGEVPRNTKRCSACNDIYYKSYRYKYYTPIKTVNLEKFMTANADKYQQAMRGA